MISYLPYERKEQCDTATFETTPAGLIWDATSLSNAFITEYMPQAPENHVKVYLFGLMYAHSGLNEESSLISEAARLLDLQPEEVESALRYWERCRLVERVQNDPPKYCFLSVQQQLLQRRALPQEQQDSDYENFAHAVCDAFGEKRTLHGGETVLAYEWVEQLKLPPEVVLMLIHHMIDTHGITFSFKKAQAIALQLSEAHVSTIEEAETVFSRSEAIRQGVRKVLNRLGMRRQPTEDELDLYAKWTTEWHFNENAVLEACRETVKGRNPSFAYLDAILSKLHSSGSGTAPEEVQSTLKEAGEETEHIRKLLGTLGISAELIDDGMRLQYRHLSSFGGAELAQLAAESVRKNGRRWTLENVSALLENWESQGIRTAEDAREHIAEVDKLNVRISELMRMAGSEQGRTLKNRTLLKKWTAAGEPDELINAAARMAAGKKDFMAYMDVLLTDWAAKGIRTPEEAEREHNTHTENRAVQSIRKTVETSYDQRPADPEADTLLSPEQLAALEALKNQ